MKKVSLIFTITVFLFALGCNKKKSSQLPTVTSTSVSDITSSGAKSGGNVTNDGGSTVSSKGICWGTSPNPTITDNKTIEGSSTGSFVSTITGLQANTTYYVRAYATNDAGTAYGSDISFTTLNTTSGGGTGTVTDIDGNTYNTVTIGTQVWMAENLKTTKYCNGDLIPKVDDPYEWSILTSHAWVHYNTDAQMGEKYGKLYNSYAVVDSRNICPCGWHVPSDGEWTLLTDYLGGESVAGGKMKSTGTQHWIVTLTGTNESGFSGMAGGSRWGTGEFNSGGIEGNWWSSTESSTSNAWARSLFYSSVEVIRLSNHKERGLSVRCLKD